MQRHLPRLSVAVEALGVGCFILTFRNLSPTSSSSLSPILFDFGGQAVNKACAFSTPPHLKKYAFPAMGCAASSLNQVGLQIHAIAQILTTSKVWRGRDQPQQASASEAGHCTSHPAAQEVFCWALRYGRDSSVGRASD